MAKGKNTNDGCVGVVGIFVLLMVIGLLTKIPKPVWIGIGVVVGLGVLVWIGALVAEAVATARKKREAAAEKTRRAQIAATKAQRVELFGKTNAGLVEVAIAAADRIGESRAAREGWLGDIDFSADIRGIEQTFGRAQELRGVADQLRALPDPAPADRALLDDAVATARALDQTGQGRVELISRCADEAELIDDSLRREDERAQTQTQRDELQRKLNTMLYGVEAASTEPADSAADHVLARVAGYREIKQQIVDGRVA
ncbi:hypothetical protein [Gordonia hydrophobica]|uniref:Uncharacterized protein n=1 Tax=Gordonia hydrophobica TaxID=40516 RepID=A0ABZ2TZ69_9ACTN|nr:hypothetical protein [Gordonia hydrophobica]MBM7368898.1 hypothetical protein [Gordonia hydrophobica]